MKEYISNVITKRGTPNVIFKSPFHSTNIFWLPALLAQLVNKWCHLLSNAFHLIL